MQEGTTNQPSGYVRTRQICGPILPIGESTWWRWVSEGKAPKGIKLSPGVTVWRAADVYALADQGGRHAAKP